MPNSKPIFSLGSVVATPGALDVLQAASVTPADLVSRHVTGDWGTTCAEDKLLNDQAVESGERILSVYEVGDKEVGNSVVWVITEADRSSTCLLLPDEY